MPRFSHPGAALAFAALTFATATATAAGAGADPAEYAITLTDGVIAPQVLEVAAGDELVLVVTNAGKRPAEFESKALHIEQVVPPGRSRSFTLHGLKAGSYVFIDDFHPDAVTAQGMIVAKGG